MAMTPTSAHTMVPAGMRITVSPGEPAPSSPSTITPTGTSTASQNARRDTVRSARAFSRQNASPRPMRPKTAHIRVIAQNTGTANSHAKARHGQNAHAYSGSASAMPRPNSGRNQKKMAAHTTAAITRPIRSSAASLLCSIRFISPHPFCGQHSTHTYRLSIIIYRDSIIIFRYAICSDCVKKTVAFCGNMVYHMSRKQPHICLRGGV